VEAYTLTYISFKVKVNKIRTSRKSTVGILANFRKWRL